MSPSLYSPEILTDNPILITPILDSADANPRHNSSTGDGMVDRQEPTPFIEKPLIIPKKDTVGAGGIVTEVQNEAYDISWPSQKYAEYYRVYGSLSPLGNTNLLADKVGDLSWIFVLPYFTEVVEYYFWVSYIDSRTGNEVYITQDPSTLRSSQANKAFSSNPLTRSEEFYYDIEILDLEQKKTLEFARKADRLMLENDGEPAWLYMRRYASDKPFGIPCSCVNKNSPLNNDPDYNGRGNCSLCFGTGIYGGYYPKVAIRIRYANLPVKTFKWSKSGQQLLNEFNTFMIWAPVVRPEDIIVRTMTGERFRVDPDKGVRTSTIRGLLVHQEFDLVGIPQNHISFNVTDDAIQKALDTAKIPKYLKSGYKVFG